MLVLLYNIIKEDKHHIFDGKAHKITTASLTIDANDYLMRVILTQNDAHRDSLPIANQKGSKGSKDAEVGRRMHDVGSRTEDPPCATGAVGGAPCCLRAGHVSETTRACH